MKKLFALLLSFQLIIMPAALAQTPSAQEGGGAGYEEKTHKELKNGGYDFYAKQVLAMSTSIIGANIISQCSFGMKVPSIAVFMAGSIVHILSEIAAAKAMNQKHNQRMSDLKLLDEELQKEGGQQQKAALEARLQEEKDALAFVKSRLMWTAAVTAIYATATGLAIAEQTGGIAAAVTAAAGACTAASGAIAAACAVTCGCPSPTCAACTPPCIAAHNVACNGLAPRGHLASQAAFAVPALPAGPGFAACMAVPPALLPTSPTPGYLEPAGSCTAGLNAYLAIAYPNCMPWTPASGLTGKVMSMAVIAAYSMGAQKISGGAGGAMSYVAMLTSLLAILVPSLQKMVMAAYNYPIPRTITFGASTLLAGAVTMGLNKRKKIHEENVKKLEKVLAAFKLQTDDPNGVDMGGMNGQPVNPLAGNELTKLQNGKLKSLATANAMRKQCFSNNGGNLDYSEGACANPIRVPQPNLSLSNGVGSLNEVGTMATDLANALASGDTSRADLLAGQIANQAARMRGLNKALQNRANENRKKNGEKPIDFDGEINKKLAEMGQAFNNAAGSKGLAGIGIGGEAALGEDLKGLAEINPETINPGALSAPGAIDPSAISAGDLNNLDVGADGDAAALAAAGDNTPTLSESLDDYESNESDISKDSSVSIFKQLSNRYILNYTKIFNRKEATPEPAQTDTKKE